MSKNMTVPSGDQIKARLKKIIEDDFKSVADFARACQDLDDSVDYYSKVQTYLKRGSMPGLDAALVMARAAGISIYELAGIEKPPTQDGSGATIPESLFDLESVKTPVGESEPAKLFAGWSMFVAGEEQLRFDVLVTGRRERVPVVEIAPNKTDVDNDA